MPMPYKLAQWQAVAFRLPLAQQQASGWWEASHSLSRLHHLDFLPQVDPPGLRDFWVTRQEETLALVQALQHCSREVRMPPGVLCDAAWGLQRCMAPLMQLDGDEIAEASLLRPTDDGPIAPPTSEEEAVLLRDEPESKGGSRGYYISPECPETPKPKEPPKQSDAPSPPDPSSTASNSHSDWPKNTR